MTDRSDNSNNHYIEEEVQGEEISEGVMMLARYTAHDISNLIQGVVGTAHMALEELIPETPAHDLIKKVVVTAYRAGDLSKQMLTYCSKAESAMQPTDMQPTNLNEVAGEFECLVESVISGKATFRQDFAQDLPLILADATQLGQVLINIVINASESFQDGSGVIYTKTGALECDRQYLAANYADYQLSEGTYVYLEVTDTGCGMDEEVRTKIFDPFFTTKSKGRGLGLASTWAIIRRHRGGIKVISEPNRGTKITVLIPAIDRPSEPESEKPFEPRRTYV